MSEDKDTKDLLKEILKWTKFTGFEKDRHLLETELDTDSKRLVYEYSNGMSSPEIEQIIGVDDSTIRDYWKEWALSGLVELHSDYKKRYRHIFSLREFGIEIPNIKVKTQPKGNYKTEIVVTEGEKNE
jgi:hypothetical protein